MLQTNIKIAGRWMPNGHPPITHMQELYPANDQVKLQDLVDTCQLMGSVLEFQQQAMGILTTGKLSDMIIESMKVGLICT